MPGRVVGATAVSWPSCPVVSRTAWPYRSAHARGRRVRAPAPCRSSPAAVSQRPSGSVAGSAASRWPCRGLGSALYRDTMPCLASCLSTGCSHDTIHCILTQPTRLSYNTTHSIAIQIIFSQYCLGSSLIQFSAQFFFFSFFIIIIFFHLFPAIGKTTKYH